MELRTRSLVAAALALLAVLFFFGSAALADKNPNTIRHKSGCVAKVIGPGKEVHCLACVSKPDHEWLWRQAKCVKYR